MGEGDGVVGFGGVVVTGGLPGGGVGVGRTPRTPDPVEFPCVTVLLTLVLLMERCADPRGRAVALTDATVDRAGTTADRAADATATAGLGVCLGATRGVGVAAAITGTGVGFAVGRAVSVGLRVGIADAVGLGAPEALGAAVRGGTGFAEGLIAIVAFLGGGGPPLPSSSPCPTCTKDMGTTPASYQARLPPPNP